MGFLWNEEHTNLSIKRESSLLCTILSSERFSSSPSSRNIGKSDELMMNDFLSEMDTQSHNSIELSLLCIVLGLEFSLRNCYKLGWSSFLWINLIQACEWRLLVMDLSQIPWTGWMNKRLLCHALKQSKSRSYRYIKLWKWRH